MQSPASTATTPTWRHMQSGAAAPHLWQKVLSNLAVSEQAVSACSASHFFHDCSKEYMRIFWKKPILHLPHDASSLASLMEMSQRLAEQEGYVEGTTVMMKLAVVSTRWLGVVRFVGGVVSHIKRRCPFPATTCSLSAKEWERRSLMVVLSWRTAERLALKISP